jgi:glucoside 3-dehydrogenase (cytochrome c) hitch-hiker subunit
MGAVSRRDALRKLAIGGAAAATAPFWVETLVSAAEQHAAHYHQAAAAASVFKPKVFNAAQNKTVTTLAEIIIPQTDTAGAAKAKVNEFIDSVLAEAKPEDKQKFLDGLAWIDARSQTDNGAPFADAPSEKQVALLTALSKNASPSPTDQPGVEFFKAIKALTVTGYYTSEVATREELGDTGQMFFTEFKGCTHTEHQ